MNSAYWRAHPAPHPTDERKAFDLWMYERIRDLVADYEDWQPIFVHDIVDEIQARVPQLTGKLSQAQPEVTKAILNRMRGRVKTEINRAGDPFVEDDGYLWIPGGTEGKSYFRKYGWCEGDELKARLDHELRNKRRAQRWIRRLELSLKHAVVR